MWLFLLWTQIGWSLATVADISSELCNKFVTFNSIWEDLKNLGLYDLGLSQYIVFFLH